MISIGILTSNLHNQKNFKNHYTTVIPIVEPDSLYPISFKIREALKPNKYYQKYVVDLLELKGQPVSGKLLLHIKIDSLKPLLQVDDILFSKTPIKPIQTPLNPNQFDYKSYLKKRYIYHQLILERKELYKIEHSSSSILGFANSIRNHISSKLSKQNFSNDELGVIKALFLGERTDISESLYENYKNAGAIHILAVSGLHVGIILIILNFILQPIERFKYGRQLKTILLIITLWLFAIVAGLSASVTRAVTMFSIVTIALNLKRPTNIYNTLAISIFVILLFKPMFLFDVGFQLSYAAVYAIVAIDPHLNKIWSPKHLITKKLWHTLTVTMSAQLGILPLSLYYFHQFPSLFFISNLIIIPLLGIILGFGILVILLTILNLLPPFIGETYSFVINRMNLFITWVAEHEHFIFKHISFNIYYLIMSYYLIIASFRLITKYNNSRLKTFLISIIVCQITILYTQAIKPKHQLVIFHSNKHSLIGNTNNNLTAISSEMDCITNTMTQTVKNYQVGNYINNTIKNSLKDFYLLNNKKLLVIDSLGAYNIKSFKPDYILLRQSPKINLKRLIDSIQPKYIIADGSNYKSYVEQWKIVCKNKKLPFHSTYEKGAFIINY